MFFMERRFFLKLTALIALFLSALTLNAQNDSDFVAEQIEKPHHEVKINAATTLLGLRPELAYEYIINQDISVGGRLSFSLDQDDLPINGVFQAMPYFRWHFFNSNSRRGNAHRAIFLEVNTAYTHFPNESIREAEFKNGPAFGAGVGLGYKYISPGYWVFEATSMIGRNFAYPEGRSLFYGGFGLTIGKRF